MPRIRKIAAQIACTGPEVTSPSGPTGPNAAPSIKAAKMQRNAVAERTVAPTEATALKAIPARAHGFRRRLRPTDRVVAFLLGLLKHGFPRAGIPCSTVPSMKASGSPRVSSMSASWASRS